ncbi:putative metal-binding protein [Leptolyngbyaceae cyanobacterium JSC-12]|nr:putative metal-binding protein [Leptolyngbyaceae cyanobacterium JSC-12]
MEPIHIPELMRAPEQTETIGFNEGIADLETLTPVQGVLRVSHRGNFLEVSARAETIITLACDRCLQQYNYRLSIQPSELIWLDESVNDEVNPILLDQDLEVGDLVETLSPQGYFDPETWLYEQLCLEIPQRKLCDAQCQGIEVPQADFSQPIVDRRWARLEAFRNQLLDKNLSDKN